MERKPAIILGIGVIICVILFFIDIYLGAMGAVILAVLAMSFLIMRDTRDLPDITARLRDDAKGILLKNNGNAPAHRIHVAIVPLDIEFDRQTLAPEESFEFLFATMVKEAKAIVVFENAVGERYSRSFPLSALGNAGNDPMKPVIPLFSWKKD
jgi:hypothetical protein